jgi:hypothetical protein
MTTEHSAHALTRSSSPGPDAEKGRALHHGNLSEQNKRIPIYNEGVDTSSVDERRLLRKLDWHLIPWLSFLYLLSFLGTLNTSHTRHDLA